MSNTTISTTGNIGTSGLLGTAFVVLKLVGVITWSWWLVLLPFYVPVVLVLLFLAVVWIISGSKK